MHDAIRMLRRSPLEQRRRFDLSAPRLMHSVDEPLNLRRSCGESACWGRPIHRNWWQTETGGIMIANCAALEIRPGSMGRPLPGTEAAIVTRVGSESCLSIRMGWRGNWPCNPAEVEPDESIREALDMDSYSFLKLLVVVSERTGVDIAEADYEQVFTLGGMQRYLSRRMA